MKKLELQKEITGKGGEFKKSWTVKQLTDHLNTLSGNLSVKVASETVSPGGNWNTAKDWFPTITVDQDSKHVTVTTFNTYGHQKKASVSTEWISTEFSDDRSQLFVRGEVDVRNWKNGKCSGSQKFCFAIFVGDSGHIYTHRAPASKGWMTASPDIIRKRLRKLGIGAVNVIQQGDFLLKPANGNAHSDDLFAHERMGFGHHNFEGPVLYHDGQFFLKESTVLKHTAVDGIQHPDVVVPPGKYIVGTTASQLSHANARD